MILGHKKQWNILKRTVEAGKYAHAYLFSGEPQIGKKTVALEFIKLLNCQCNDTRNRPCNTCRSCRDIQKQHHPDLIVIEPQGSTSRYATGKKNVSDEASSTKKEIKISQIRRLQWQLSLHSYSAPFKIAILNEAHTLNLEAASAFLKTLEEPKGKTIVILITPYPEMMLTTILSRVQMIKFYSVDLLEIENYLIKKGFSKERAREYAFFSLGKPGKAINYLTNSQTLRDREDKIRELAKIINSDLAYRFQYAKELSQNFQVLQDVLDVWLNCFRAALLSKIRAEKSSIFAIDFSKYSITRLKSILDLIQKTNFLLFSTNINTKLALEILMIEI